MLKAWLRQPNGVYGCLVLGITVFVEVTMPAPVAAHFYRLERLDGIGPARFAEIWQLEDIELRIQEVTQ